MAFNNTPDFQVLNELAERLRTVDSQPLPLGECSGRFLASPLCADRDSPACNVSAMDGFGFRLSDAVIGNRLAVTAVSRPGNAPPPCPPPGCALQIFTGAPVPSGCELVVQREHAEESPPTNASEIVLRESNFHLGMNIRQQGENALSGSTIRPSGSFIHAGAIAAAANFGADTLRVHRRVRVQIIVTGDELHRVDQEVEPWQLRDSNGPTLASLLSHQPWLEILPPLQVGDSLEQLVSTLQQALRDADAVLLTGGVSMGNFDFVPAAVQNAGLTTVFHKLPIRPGRPILGGVSSDGQLVLGLPGNPVSAAVGGLRFAIPLLAKMGGAISDYSPKPRVTVATPHTRSLPLHCFRLVRVHPDGYVDWVSSQGSGDLVSLAHSDGFVEVPKNETGTGPWSYWSWY